MKKSVKILIVVLCLIVIGLVTFIVADKVINKKVEENTIAEENNIVNSVSNNTENISNETAEDNEVENNSENSSNSVAAANEAIKKALKDQEWVKANLLPDYFNETDEYSKGLQDITEMYFAKIHSIDGNPAYIVNVEDTANAAPHVNLVTYKNGKVVVSENPIHGEYSILTADLNKNIISIMNDPTGITSVYKIENNEFVEFAKCDFNYNDNTMNYYVNGENVSYDQYQSFIKDCVEIKTELNDENIDKYVK